MRTKETEHKSSEKQNARRFHKCLVFGSCYLVMVVNVGFFYAFGSLFVSLMKTFNSTRGETAVIQSTMLAVGFSSGLINGVIIHRIGIRNAGLYGACVGFVGLLVSFFATSVTFLVLTIGVLVALGFGSVGITGCIVVAQHFNGKSRMMCMSFVSTGAGVGGMVYPYVFNYLSYTFGIRGTFLIIAAVSLNAVPAALLWKDQLQHATSKHEAKYNTEIHETKPEYPETQETKSENPETHETELQNQKTHETKTKNHGNQETQCEILESMNNDRTLQNSISQRIQCWQNTEQMTGINEVHRTQTKTVQNATMIDEGHLEETILQGFKYLVTNKCFVMFAIGLVIINNSLNIVLIFIDDIFQSNGFSKKDVSLGLLILNVLNLIGRLLPGVTLQYKLMSTMCVPIITAALAVVAMVGFILADTLALSLFFCCLVGMPFGISSAMFTLIPMKLVGLRRLPNAIGILFTINGMCFAATGPLTGLIRDYTGTYYISFAIAVTLTLLSIVLLITANVLRRKQKKLQANRCCVFYRTKF